MSHPLAELARFVRRRAQREGLATPPSTSADPRTALLALRGDESLTLEELQESARKHISGYKVPRELHIVDEVPRAPSGKPDYPRAQEIALEGSSRV